MTTLPLKYRPGKFSEVVGNESTIRLVKSKVRLKNPPHIYLITGPSGTGKTTLGRLIAKYVKATGHNFKEMDNATYKGIDTVRDIRKVVKFTPLGAGTNRAWLMDECHELTPPAQEALLTLFEDNCPSHAFFILCTTEPEKLKITLRRRCTHLELHPLDDDAIEQALTDTAAKEDKKVPRKIIEEIVERSIGSMGIALNLLDTIIDLPFKDMIVQIKNNKKTKSASIDLCRALINKEKWKVVAGIIKGIDPGQEETVRRAVLGYTSNILLKKDDAKAFLIMEAFIAPFYDNPKGQLIKAAYECLYAD